MTQSVSEAGPGTPETVELLAIAVKYNAVRCRRLTDGGIVTPRPAGGVREEAEGQTLTVVPIREWSYMRGHYLSGKVVGARVDMAAVAARFGLPPLALHPEGIWDPLEEDWLGLDLDEILAEEGGAPDLGEVVAEKDGVWDDANEVEVPLVGGTVHPNGDRRRREDADGLGLALWRLGRTDEARAVFVRMLWLNPMDNQGTRFLLADLDAGKTYLEIREEEERRWRHLYGDRSP